MFLLISFHWIFINNNSFSALSSEDLKEKENDVY